MQEVFIAIVAGLLALGLTQKSDYERLSKTLEGVDNVEVQESDGNAIILFKDPMFEIGSFALTDDSLDIADTVSEVLADGFSTRLLYVEGHTDNTGSFQVNKPLSEARAKQVADRILKAGHKPNLVAVTGYADQFPRCDNDSPEGRQCNRRVQIVLIKQE